MKISKKKSFLISSMMVATAFTLCTGSSFSSVFADSQTSKQPTETVYKIPEKLAENTVYVNANNKLNKIKKELFGVHVPAWNETIFDHGVLNKQLVKELKDAGVGGFLVYPGGNYGANFIWNKPNLPTEMTTDQFLELSKELNGTVKISVNENQSPEMAADWIKYVNKEKKAGVKYWEIADEPYLTTTVDKFIAKVKQFAPVMKKADPSIKIIANVSAYNPAFTKKVISEVGEYIDVYSIHHLPLAPSSKYSPGSPYTEENKEKFYQDLLQTPDTLRTEISTVKGWVKEAGIDKDVEYHIGSFNTVWWGPEDWTVNSLPVGLWMTDILGTFAEEKIDAAAYWALMNPYPPGSGDFGIVSPAFKPYVNYYPYQLYNKHFGKTLVESQSNIEDSSSYASVSKNGDTLYLMLVNKSPNEAKTINFDLGKYDVRGDAAAWILDGPVVADHLNHYGLRKEAINNVSDKFSWTVPAYSAVAIEIPRKNSKHSLEETPNLAKFKTGEASSIAFQTDYAYAQTYDFMPDKAIDGDLTTRWASKIFKKEQEYIQIDLGSTKKFDHLKFYWDYYATKFNIEVSNDGKEWTKAADQTNAIRTKEAPQPIDEVQFSTPVEARYIKLNMTERPKTNGIKAGASQWTPDAFSLWEIEAYLK